MAEIWKFRNKEVQLTSKELSCQYLSDFTLCKDVCESLASIPFSQVVLKHSSLSHLKVNRVEDALKLSLQSHDLGLRQRIDHRYRVNVSAKRLQSRDKDSNGVPADQGVLAKNGLADTKEPRDRLSNDLPAELKYQETFVRNGIPDICEVMNAIPEEWTVVQLTSLPTKGNCFRHYGDTKSSLTSSDLLIARHSRTQQQPVVAHVVPKKNSSKVDGTTSVFEMLTELLQDNYRVNETLRSDKDLYWKKRNLHHEKMQEVIRAIELEYLGPWRHLLSGNIIWSDISLKPQFEAAVKELTNFGMSPDKSLLVVNAIPYLTQNDLVTLLPSSISKTELKTWMARYEKLKIALKAMKRNPVILILDKVTQTLPWESLYCLQRQSVTRLPSLSLLKLLADRHKNHKKIGTLPLDGSSVRLNPLDSYYLLNPAGDLGKVQERLEMIVKAIWKSEGKVQCAPRSDLLLEKFKTKDVFVYLGHGSGTQFIGGETIGKSFIKAAATLFGCSSAKMIQLGPRVDPMGTVVHYLIAGSPACVGMLWEVTDVDCDKMTVRFWQHWLGEKFPTLDQTAIADVAKYIDYNFKCDEESDLATCAALAREGAKSFLNRCALVVYGIPTRSVTS